MKIEKIQAYKSNDGCVWETEKEAFEQNIHECLEKIEWEEGKITCFTVKEWFRNNKASVKYILANIDKI